MSLKETYVAKAEAEFAEVQSQISALAKKAHEAVAAGKAEGEKLLHAAQTKHDEAHRRLEAVKQAGEESWETVKLTFETAWTDLRHALGPVG